MIYTAAHIVLPQKYGGGGDSDATKWRYMAVYSHSAAPTKAAVVAGGVTIALDLLHGSSTRGVYASPVYTFSVGSACVTYYFYFESVGGVTQRFPASGSFSTLNENICTTWYTAGSTSVSTVDGTIASSFSLVNNNYVAPLEYKATAGATVDGAYVSLMHWAAWAIIATHCAVYCSPVLRQSFLYLPSKDLEDMSIKRKELHLFPGMPFQAWFGPKGIQDQDRMYMLLGSIFPFATAIGGFVDPGVEGMRRCLQIVISLFLLMLSVSNVIAYYWAFYQAMSHRAERFGTPDVANTYTFDEAKLWVSYLRESCKGSREKLASIFSFVGEFYDVVFDLIFLDFLIFWVYVLPFTVKVNVAGAAVCQLIANGFGVLTIRWIYVSGRQLPGQTHQRTPDHMFQTHYKELSSLHLKVLLEQSGYWTMFHTIFKENFSNYEKYLLNSCRGVGVFQYIGG